MAKHRSRWTRKRFHKLIDEGRGQGILNEYKPWITIHDIASRGVSSRVFGRKTGRIHHLLSRNETAFFYILDASDKVMDIREQFPLLPLDETVEIAEAAGIRYPRDNRSFYPYVLTSDFVITTPEGLKVRSVKLSCELQESRVMQKLEIERRYWTKRGVDWKLVTENQIDYQRAANLEWIGRSQRYPEMVPEGTDPDGPLAYFLELYHETELSVADIASLTETMFGMGSGMGLTVFQYLLLTKRIIINMSSSMDLVSPRVPEREGVGSWIETFA